MVTAEAEQTTICLVLDCMPEQTIAQQKLLLRPNYKVATLFEDIRRQFNHSSFSLQLQTGESKAVLLNNLSDLTVKEIGVKFEKNIQNKIYIVPSSSVMSIENATMLSDSRMMTDEQVSKDSESTKVESNTTVDGEESSDDDLALGASASPTESTSNIIPLPPVPPALPSTFNYVDSSTSTTSKQMCFRRINSTERSNNFVGLVNQAMTCYLNSLLQALYMTPEFRNALYNWEFDGNGETKSIPYQLQKLFCNLQTSSKAAVETTDLTKSFGWDSTEAWQQHDIQELCRVMFDALELKFKNTKEEDLISRLYEGKMIDYVKCLECGTEKSREDTFLDIPLPVRPFGNPVAYGSIEEALRAFIQPETLDGNNQYHCEKCNRKCDAHKGLKFSKFPYILTFHLKRFDFDYQTLHRIKLNDKVTFPQQLNLNEFVANPQDSLIGPPVPSDVVSVGQESVESAVKCDDCSTTDSGSALEEDNLSGTNFQNGGLPLHQAESVEDDEGIDMNADVKSIASTNADGPYNYELFAIMIHSGSASGGHYYAYIKDFESCNWYSFNDQTVSSITQEDIQRSFGGGSSKAYYSSAYSSSTNAYMLMYRKVDPVRNCKFINENQFPEHIKQLQVHLKETESTSRHVAREYIGSSSGSDLVAKLKVYFFNPQLGRMTDNKIYISSDSTLRETVEEAHRKLAKNVPGSLDLFRIVAYDDSSMMVERSLEDRDSEQIGYIINSLNTNSTFLLEMRKEDEDFELYLPGGINTNVFTVDYHTSDIDGPVLIRGLLKGSIRDYKQVIAKKLKLNAEKLIIGKIGANGDQKAGAEFSCSVVTILNNDEISLIAEQLHLSHKIFVAEVEVLNDDTRLKVKKIVERYEHVITLYVVVPDTSQGTLNQMSIPLYDESCQDYAYPRTPTTPISRECVGVTSLSYNLDLQVSPLPPLEALGECNSEDSSLSDSDRTLVDMTGGSAIADELTSTSPALSDPDQLSSPDDSHRGAVSDCDLMSDNDVEMASMPSTSPLNASNLSARVFYFRATPIVETGQLDGEDQVLNLLKVLVDRSMTFHNFKKHLAPILRVSHQYFKIFYASNSKSTEIVRMNDTLSALKDGTRLSIGLGRALQEGEYKSKIFYLNMNEIDDETEKLPFLCEWILKENTTVKQTLSEILAHVVKIYPQYAHLSLEKTVLRKKSYKNPTKVLLDYQTFGDDIYLGGTETQLVLQELHEDSPRVQDPDDLIFFGRRWYPSTRSLGKFHEFVISKDDGELVNVLSVISGIPEDNIEYSKLSSSFPRCNVSLGSIPNLVWTSTKVPISNSWSTLMDGSLFFYKDVTEPLKEVSCEETQNKEICNKPMNDFCQSNRASNLLYSPKRERALKIYVDSPHKKELD